MKMPKWFNIFAMNDYTTIELVSCLNKRLIIIESGISGLQYLHRYYVSYKVGCQETTLFPTNLMVERKQEENT